MTGGGVRRGDDATPPVPFAELRAPYALGAWDVEITARTLARLHAGLGSDPAGPAPWVLGANLGLGLAFRALPRNVAHLGGWCAVTPAASGVAPGDRLRVRGAITAVAQRRGRVHATVNATVQRIGSANQPWQEGDPPPDAPGPRWTVRTDLVVPDADPAGLPDATGVGLPIPGTLGPVIRTLELSLDAMRAFSGPGNFHSDADIARRFGYPRPVAQGLHLVALARPAPPPPGSRLVYRFCAAAFDEDRLDVHSEGPAEHDGSQRSSARDPGGAGDFALASLVVTTERTGSPVCVVRLMPADDADDAGRHQTSASANRGRPQRDMA